MSKQIFYEIYIYGCIEYTTFTASKTPPTKKICNSTYEIQHEIDMYSKEEKINMIEIFSCYFYIENKCEKKSRNLVVRSNVEHEIFRKFIDPIIIEIDYEDFPEQKVHLLDKLTFQNEKCEIDIILNKAIKSILSDKEIYQRFSKDCKWPYIEGLKYLFEIEWNDVNKEYYKNSIKEIINWYSEFTITKIIETLHSF